VVEVSKRWGIEAVDIKVMKASKRWGIEAMKASKQWRHQSSGSIEAVELSKRWRC
jgi:hypothetical protein